MDLQKGTYCFVAIAMTFLMFLSSVGLVVDMHFCQGKLKSVSFTGKAKRCHDVAAKSMSACSHHKKVAEKEESCSEDEDCCSDKVLHLQFDQDKQIQSFNWIAKKQLQSSLFAITHIALFPTDFIDVGREFVPHHYKPPLICRDIPIFNQSFLL